MSARKPRQRHLSRKRRPRRIRTDRAEMLLRHSVVTLRFIGKMLVLSFRRTVLTLRWWWNLPPWLKWGKLLAVILAIAALLVMDSLRQWWHYRDIYTTYHSHFYAEYSKTMPHFEANLNAGHYADFYARYYSSPAYRQSLQHALPSATAESVSFPPQSPVATNEVNAAGLALIKRFEGLELEPYADAGGKLTIGYGHLIKPGEFFGRISEEQAHQLLREDIRVAEAYVKRYVKVQLNTNQFSALVSLVYNIGPGNFRKSTLLRLLNQGEGDKAANEFIRWNKVGTRTLRGLTKRREAERELFGKTPL